MFRLQELCLFCYRTETAVRIEGHISIVMACEVVADLASCAEKDLQWKSRGMLEGAGFEKGEEEWEKTVDEVVHVAAASGDSAVALLDEACVRNEDDVSRSIKIWYDEDGGADLIGHLFSAVVGSGLVVDAGFHRAFHAGEARSSVDSVGVDQVCLAPPPGLSLDTVESDVSRSGVNQRRREVFLRALLRGVGKSLVFLPCEIRREVIVLKKESGDMKHLRAEIDDVALMIRCWWPRWRFTEAYKKRLPSNPPRLATDHRFFLWHFGGSMLSAWKEAEGCEDWLSNLPDDRWNHFEKFVRDGLQWHGEVVGRPSRLFTDSIMEDFWVDDWDLDRALLKASDDFYVACTWWQW